MSVGSSNPPVIAGVTAPDRLAAASLVALCFIAAASNFRLPLAALLAPSADTAPAEKSGVAAAVADDAGFIRCKLSRPPIDSTTPASDFGRVGLRSLAKNAVVPSR